MTLSKIVLETAFSFPGSMRKDHPVTDDLTMVPVPKKLPAPKDWEENSEDKVVLFFDEQKLIGMALDVIEVSKRMWQFLQKNQLTYEERTDDSTWPEHLLKEAKSMFHDSEQAIIRFFAILKYKYDQFDLGQNPTISSRAYKVGAGIEQTIDTPSHRLPLAYGKSKSSFISMLIDDSAFSDLRQSLTIDYEPLAAMPHLHRAINELEPKHRWIDATIAAELAIKEFLVRTKPELEPLLIRLPSPAPSTLYGKVMEEYFGTPSPMAKRIQKGEQVRNKLVHSPTAVTISEQDALEYVKDIEYAILHLRSLLSPDDKFIQDKFAKETQARST